ncbi:hypothetical protein ACMHYO_14130 [Allopusillimonas ginsengisoli]|uniref:hypothetical protein n=1 Tax=Allopusillimonas ginsengisoli TaxID=453575 RepID=UPI0039C45146
MKTIWSRLTLQKFATEDDNGEIPPLGWLGAALVAAGVWAAWAVAMMIVKG